MFSMFCWPVDHLLPVPPAIRRMLEHTFCQCSCIQPAGIFTILTQWLFQASPLSSVWWAEQRVKRAQTLKRGPPSAPVEINQFNQIFRQPKINPPITLCPLFVQGLVLLFNFDGFHRRNIHAGCWILDSLYRKEYLIMYNYTLNNQHFKHAFLWK